MSWKIFSFSKQEQLFSVLGQDCLGRIFPILKKYFSSFSIFDTTNKLHIFMMVVITLLIMVKKNLTSDLNTELLILLYRCGPNIVQKIPKIYLNICYPGIVLQSAKCYQIFNNLVASRQLWCVARSLFVEVLWLWVFAHPGEIQIIPP